MTPRGTASTNSRRYIVVCANISDELARHLSAEVDRVLKTSGVLVAVRTNVPSTRGGGAEQPTLVVDVRAHGLSPREMRIAAWLQQQLPAIGAGVALWPGINGSPTAADALEAARWRASSDPQLVWQVQWTMPESFVLVHAKSADYVETAIALRDALGAESDAVAGGATNDRRVLIVISEACHSVPDLLSAACRVLQSIGKDANGEASPEVYYRILDEEVFNVMAGAFPFDEIAIDTCYASAAPLECNPDGTARAR